MTKNLLFFGLLLLSCVFLHAQVGIGTPSPNASAQLDVNSTSRGLLPPRMSSAQRKGIVNPAEGLMVYDLDLKSLQLYNGSRWVGVAQKQESLNDAPGDFVSLVSATAGYPTSIKLSDNALYVAGLYTGSLTLGSFTVNSNGGNDIFFGKFDLDGNAIWLKSIGSTVSDRLNTINVDGDGNVYIAGGFYNTVDFDPNAGIHNISSSGDEDGFYAKYDNDGNWIWNKKISGTSADEITQLIVNSTDVYISGVFNGTANFNLIILTSAGQSDGFVARYQSSDGNMGATGWVTKIGSTQNDYAMCLSFIAGGVVVGGGFSGTCNFGGGGGVTSAGSTDGFLAEYNFSGNVIDVFPFAGTGEDRVYQVKVQGGFIYSTGLFTNQCDFDPGSGFYFRISVGNYDAFVAKLNTNGVFQWATSFGGTDGDFGAALTLDASSNIYVCGEFMGDAFFSPYELHGNSLDAFIVKLSDDGALQWVQTAGSTSPDFANDLVVTNNGNTLFVACQMAINPFLGFDKLKYNSGSFYIAKYKE